MGEEKGGIGPTQDWQVGQTLQILLGYPAFGAHGDTL
jgi:hypothetical protein